MIFLVVNRSPKKVHNDPGWLMLSPFFLVPAKKKTEEIDAKFKFLVHRLPR
jgi:hypothetical protein